jgi:hypothetical protein
MENVIFKALWSILRPFGIFCGHLVYFMVSWYIVPVLVYCTKKNLATLFSIGTGDAIPHILATGCVCSTTRSM